MAEEYIESPAARGTRPFPAFLLVLQALLIAVVVGWVLDLYRPAGFNFYTEQMLLAETGLALGIRFLVTSKKHPYLNLLASLAGLGLCLVLAWPAHWRRLAALVATVIVGTLVSLAVELLQVYAPLRVSSLTDVVINAIGTLAGGLIAIVYLELGITLRIPGVVSGRRRRSLM